MKAETKQFIEKHDIGAIITQVKVRPDDHDFDSKARHYQFTLRIGEISFGGYYSQGSGIKTHPKTHPTREDILYSLLSDASFYSEFEGPTGLDDFASEMGIEKPSSAIKAYEACKSCAAFFKAAKIDINEALEIFQNEGY